MSMSAPTAAVPDLERAEWSTAFINSLPDSSFAFIESGGSKDEEGKTTPRSLRHLPYKDASGKVDKAHVRNALARLRTTQIPDAAKASAKRKLVAAAKSVGVEVSDEEERAMSVPTTGKIINFFAPIRAIDDETWEIEGVMSDEGVDTFKTGFDYESMKRAAEEWAGNIREQHDKNKAVGRRVYVSCDDESKTVLLRAMISKGAPDTWQKIKEGVLTGFSIAAYDVQGVEYRTVGDKRIPYFKDFKLAEVSVVDVPSNPGARASGLTIYRAAGFAGAEPFFGGDEFAVYEDSPAAAPAAVEPGLADAPPAAHGTAPAVAAASVETPAVPATPVDQDKLETLRRALAGEQSAVEGEDPQVTALRRAQAAQAFANGRQAAQMQMASGLPAAGTMPFATVPLSPISEDELLPDAAGQAAALPVSAPAMNIAAPAAAMTPALAGNVSLEGQQPGTYVPRHARQAIEAGAGILTGAPAANPGFVEVNLPDPVIPEALPVLARADGDSSNMDQQMEGDTGSTHQHSHAHASGYSPLHVHDHKHDHTDGTSHKHPHMHAHDHHDHYGDEEHAHPHTHVHDHSHEFRTAAPDLSRIVEPYPDQPGKTRAALETLGKTGLIASSAVGTPVTPAAGVPGISQQQRAQNTPAKGETNTSAGDEPDDDHPGEDESGEDEDDQNTSRAADPATIIAVVTPDTEAARKGARVSASMRDSLHNIRDTAMKECNCAECQDLLGAKDTSDEEEGEEGDDGGRAITGRLERLQVAKITRSIRKELEAPLQAAIAQLRAVGARLTSVPSMTELKRMQAQVDETRSVSAEVLRLVALIAESEEKNQPLTRAADPRLTPVEKVLPTSPQAILDASAPGGGSGAVTPEMIQAELAHYQRAIAAGQLTRQEDQIAIAQRLVQKVNGIR